MSMKGQTLATLEQLEQADWFANVGTFNNIQDRSKIHLLSSWQEAAEHCGSIEWENLCLEATNQFCERILKRSPERFRRWNDIVQLVKPTTIALVQRKMETAIREHDLPKVVVDTVEWDILGLLMEAEYADICPPAFYASQGYWYVKGHFPCGWEGGPFPKGRLVLY